MYLNILTRIYFYVHMHNGNFRANLFPVIKRPINKKSPYVKYNYEIIANNIEVLKKHHLFAGKYRCDEVQFEALPVFPSEHIKYPCHLQTES